MQLRPTATGLDNLPAWFLKVGAPFFAAPIADMFNLSLTTSDVPKQWKAALVSPVLKISKPLTPADYRPISITPVLSRVMERIIVRDHIYPSLQRPPPGLIFDDQFAFRPSGSTAAALIKLIQEISTMLETNPYVIVYAIDFSKAFDTYRPAQRTSRQVLEDGSTRLCLQLARQLLSRPHSLYAFRWCGVRLHRNISQHHPRIGSWPSFICRYRLRSSPTHPWKLDGEVR